MAELRIPDDLKDDYEFCVMLSDVPNPDCQAKYDKALIERIAKLEADLALAKTNAETNERLLNRAGEDILQLRATIERLKAPVSDEEQRKFALHSIDLVNPHRRAAAMLLQNVNALIAARAKGEAE